MERYAKFVRSNEDAVRLLESVLQTIVFFLPSRYIDHGGAEIWAEAGYSASNLLGVLHDHLLNGQYPVSHSIPPTWARNSIAASMTIAGDTSGLHKTRLILTVLSYTEILLEKLACRHGGADDLVVVIEAIKAFLRLLVLVKRSQPLLLDGGKYWSTHVADSKVEHAAVVAAAAQAAGPGLGPPASPSLPGSMERPQVATGRRTGRRFHYIPRAVEPGGEDTLPASPARAVPVIPEEGGEGEGDAEALLVPQASLTAVVTTGGRTALEEDEERERRRQLLVFVGEVLHIFRPFIYAYYLRTSRRRAWWPLLASAMVDYGSHVCTQRGLGEGVSSLDPLQQQELDRRRALWLLYLLRSPLFQLLTEPAANGLGRSLSGVPIVGGLSSYALMMLRYIQAHYFYTSGS